MSSEISMHSAMSAHFTAKLCFRAARAVPRLGSGRALTCLSTSASTSSMSFEQVLNKMARATTSCSAWAMRSEATMAGSAVSSHITKTSEGPASMSMPHLPLTMLLAAVTHMFPGPQMTSQEGTVRGVAEEFDDSSGSSRPNAMVAIAWAPPTLRKTSASATWAAARVIGAGLGLLKTTVGQPAARAVTAVIKTLEGRGYRPPGA
mmetsp:Transcript_7920/g.16334  ORF Transcript_7920/g.16334 Transcript_7920/m.16334 type:complete len:205 (-) Transcript_7920:701-1315(-)